MSEPELAQIYLITPPVIDLEEFPAQLASVLDTVDVGCLRLSLTSQDQDHIAKAADMCREIAHARDVALVIDQHVQLVESLGLDGVHFGQGSRSVRKARETFGEDAIVGAYCGNSRHEGLNAGEAGVDYVCFGPAQANALGDGTAAESDLFAWWTEMVEVPVVAEGNLDAALVRSLADKVDFFAFGAEVWEAADPVAAIRELADART